MSLSTRETKKRSIVTACLLTCASLLVSSTAHAQDIFEPTVHWAYASFFGTGWYKINDERSAFILRMSPRWKVGEFGIDENGNREIAYTFRVPLTIGVNKLDFDDTPGIIDLDNLTTVSANFSVDADIPLTRRFSIRPSAEVGYGTVIDESDSAWTYKTELKSRYTFQAGKLDWGLLFDIGFVGYEPNSGEADDFTFAAAGAEFAYPVSWFSAPDSQTMLYWHASYTDFLDEVEFQTGINEFDSVANFWHVGAALGKRDKPIRIWFLNFDRLGLGYNFSTTGELRGVKFIFRSLYEL